MTLTLVFSVGVDPELLSARNFVLQSAGYFVGAVYLLKEAADYFKGGDFDMVLRYQSTPTNEKDRLNSWIRDSGSRIPVVSVSDKLKEKDRFAGITAWSDPNELLMGISHALSKAAIPSTLTEILSDKQEVSAVPQKSPASSGHCEGQKTVTPEHASLFAHAGRLTLVELSSPRKIPANSRGINQGQDSQPLSE